MAQKKGRSFVEGAIILSFSTILVKVIGAFFRIPITNIIGTTAMGYFSSAYTIYNFMFVLSTSGLPTTVSRMVASNIVQGRNRDSKKLLKIAFSTYSVVGLAASVAMFFFADGFAALISNSSAASAIKAIAPAVFFISVVAPIKGYFQGNNDMLPTAVGNIIEALSKLAIGILAALVLINNGASLEVVAAGAIFGVTVGTILSAVYNFIRYSLFSKKHKSEMNAVQIATERTSKDIFKEFITTAVPITLGAVTMHLSNLIDLGLVMRQLQSNPEVTQEIASKQYGAYSAMAVTLTNFPTTLIYTIGISVIPIIAAAFTMKNFAKMKESINSALKIACIIAIPCALVFAVYSRPILELLYSNAKDGVEIAVPLLTNLSFSIITISLANITNNILQAVKKPTLPVIHLLIGGVIKIVANYILIGRYGIWGAPFATNLSYLAVMVLNFISIKKHININLKIKDTVIKPAVSFGIGLSISYAAFLVITNYLNSTALVNGLVMFGCFAISAVIYIILLIFTKCLDKNDIILLPKGEKLLKILEKRGWMV